MVNPVAGELGRSRPKMDWRGLPGRPRQPVLRRLRRRAGASSLATM